MRRILLAPLLAASILLASAAVAQADITVNVTDDPSGAGECLNGGQCSLRQAVAAASPDDTIVLGANTYKLTQGTNIIISKSLVLQGDGVTATTIDGSANSGSNQFGSLARILRTDGGTVTIEGLAFTGGIDEEDENCSSGCNTINANGGGALFNNGATVTLRNVLFRDNFGSGTPLGGAVSNGSGTLNMTDVSFTHNAAGVGGALFTRNGTVTGTGVTFENNATTCCDGGAAYLLGGTVSLTNTTIVSSSGFNSSGAIANGGAALTLDNATLSNNGADIQTDTGASTTVTNTILATGNPGEIACEPPGRLDGLTDGHTGNAVTTDGGNNLVQDKSCGLTGSGDLSNVDPVLASIADNGGPTRTQALLAGSPALGAANEANCPATDQRGFDRANPCDIGAFEAVFVDQPSVTTQPADNVQQTQADLHADVNFSGEAGAYRFKWGTAPDALNNTTGEIGGGVLESSTPESTTVTGLSAGVTYYFQAFADNATGTASGEVLHFTTQAGPPVISDVHVDSVTDTTATIDFTIDPQGNDTSYVINYGPDTNYGNTFGTFDIGSTPGPQSLTKTLTNLGPSSTIHFQIVASNGVQQDVASDDQTFTTAEQLAGTVGMPFEVDDSGVADTCPTAPTVDWGDGTQPDQGNITCQPDPFSEGLIDYEVSDNHTYASPGHFAIRIIYDDLGTETDKFAQVSPASAPTVSVVSPSSGPAGGGTTVTITGTNFTNASAVKFGSNSATSFTVDSDSQITAISPPGSGTVDVTVTAPSGTSATGASDRYAYQQPSSGPTQPPSGPTPPIVFGGAPTSRTSNGASMSGTVNPEGTSTQAFFQYGLDLSQRGPGASTELYDQSTPLQTVGSDSSDHTITAPLTGLIPGALYHVRLVAINGAGTTFGQDQTFTTAQAPAPPPPVLGKSEDIKPVSGTVFIRTANGQFIPLTGATQIPTGTVIDALHGSLQLLAALGKGKTDHGIFGGAVFRVTQSRNGLTTLSLIEGLFKGGPTYAICKAHKANDATIASSKTLQLLKASAHGKFSTKGRYSAATVRGTVWTVADRCDGTLTHVITDSVAVTDFVRHKTVILHAGQSYLALAKPPHKRR